MANEREAEQADIGQQALRQLHVVHAQVAEAGGFQAFPSSSAQARAPRRSTKRRSSPGAIGFFRRSTKWTSTRRSLKKRRAAWVGRESTRPNTWTWAADAAGTA